VTSTPLLGTSSYSTAAYPLSSSSSSSSTSAARTSSTGIGNYIAYGLGLPDTFSQSSLTSARATAGSHNTNATTNSTQNATYAQQATAVPTSSSSTSATIVNETHYQSILPTTPRVIWSIALNNITSGPTAAGFEKLNATTSGPTALTFGNATSFQNSTDANSTLHKLTYSGGCRDQWNEYWSYSAFHIDLFTNDIVTLTTLVPEITLTTEFGIYTVTETWEYTSIAYEGALPTSTTISKATETDTISGGTDTYTASYTTGYTIGASVITNLSINAGPGITPTCALPSIVPQCQSQWDSRANYSGLGPVQFTCSYSSTASYSSASAIWASGYQDYIDIGGPPFYAENQGPTLICSQASIAATECNSLVSYFMFNTDN